jgi:hypothetical protein
MNSPNLAAKIQKLAQVAQELRKGSDFSVTRLTVVKSLCEDSEAANRFALHLARLTHQKMKRGNQKLLQYRTLAARAISLMEDYLKRQTTSKASSLREILREIAKEQNEYQKVGWQMVRLIKSQELLLIEFALHCVLSRWESGHWGYQIARVYAERYSSKYGGGLIPKSAPMMEDIADFWCRRHLGKTLKQCLSSWKQDPPKRSRTPSPRKAVRASKVGPFAESYPNIAKWAEGDGWIEIGHDDCQPSFIRVLDIGGMIWDSGRKGYKTVDQALADAEAAITKWREENER